MLDQLLDSSLTLSLKTPLILMVLIALEAVLSADNAIALAAIAQGFRERGRGGRFCQYFYNFTGSCGESGTFTHDSLTESG